MDQEGRVIPVDIEDEMKVAYLDYAMSVIVGRALPDVRDGLKPVHRRVLYAMAELGLTPDKSHKKSARVVGEVLGKYHPHGESAVYDTLVRMAQDFSMRYLLVDGHGNFGSVDGDAAAAMRYTEVRLAPLATELLWDMDKDTVDFRTNFDDSLEEPVVLPARVPNLLLNGSSGIAVGMATNIPPHNLREVVDALIMVIENPDISVEGLLEAIEGPDFPTGGQIMGRQPVIDAYKTGQGSITIRGVAEVEEVKGGKSQIVITELPYQVNKAALIEKIADLVKGGKLEGIQDLRDESDRDGMRVVIELKRRSRPRVILNRLYKHTRLQVSFGINMLALVDGEPRVLNLKDILHEYLKHQREVVTRRTQFLLNKAEARAHILEGLRIALQNLDQVIALIRKAPDVKTAKGELMNRFDLSDVQAQAILDMRLQKLTGLEREKVEEEYTELTKQIEYYQLLLAHKERIDGVIKEEIRALVEKYGDDRYTRIVSHEGEIDVEDLIPREDVLITLTHKGYINRAPLTTYRSQHRGGLGIKGMITREEDFMSELFMATTHDYLLFFTNRGYLYRLKVYEVPENHRQGKGMALINLLPLQSGEYITAVIPIQDYTRDVWLFMATRKGLVKRTRLDDFQTRYTTLRALSLREDDELIAVRYNAEEEQDIMLGTALGKSIRFAARDVRPLGRTAQGVKGIALGKGDEVIGMEMVEEGLDLLTVSRLGYSKRTKVAEYRPQRRGGKGIFACRVTEQSGKMAGFRMVREKEDVMAVTRDGRLIRLKAREVPCMGRAARGVRLMRLAKGDEVVSLVRIKED